MIRWVWLSLILFFPFLNYAQQTQYVNVDALPVYEYPDTSSQILLLVHAPSKISIKDISEDDYKQFPKLLQEWTTVKYMITNTQYNGEHINGYIEKKYLVNSLSDITVMDVDTTQIHVFTRVGGENSDSLIAPQIHFRESYNGRCYYINSKGKREYTKQDYCMPRQSYEYCLPDEK